MDKMEDKSHEVVMAISNAARYMDPFFKLTAMGTVLLLQYFARMVKERKLKVTEFTDFQKFLKATDGKYDIMNVPEIPEGQLTEELDTLGIHYMIMPDLEKNDGMIQVAVYQPDRDNFGAWYQRHIMSRMTGGEKELQELKNLTSGKTTIVSFPLEDEEETIQEDFTSMGINYSQLPDLHVGDGEIQIVVANADLPKVESWYKLYRNDLLNEGVTDIPDMKKMSMDNYMQTGQQTEAEYIDTAAPELKAANLMQDRKAQTVVKALNTIERSYGERLFRNVFKTITVDNGVEFSDAEGLERSRRNKKKKRTKVYYCHPYSSCERGSNENANRLIRRHIPKGVNFDKKRQSEIKEIETWINNYPRKLFGYNTAEEQFVYEMEKLTG